MPELENDQFKMRQFTLDAKRTEPDYVAVCARLKDTRTVRLLHAAMGMATEAGEFLDQMKRHIYYGRPLDLVNVIEEVGDSTWYERIALDEAGIEYLEAIALNVRKLRARFPDRFTEGNATDRNLAEERRVLEGK